MKIIFINQKNTISDGMLFHHYLKGVLLGGCNRHVSPVECRQYCQCMWYLERV